jgi:hypothetical protein
MNVDPGIKQLQGGLNQFTGQFLKGINPIIEDGITGPATEARIKLVKFYLGYQGPLNAVADDTFNQRMHHPGDAQFSSAERVARGAERRAEQRKEADANQAAAAGAGVSTFDGVPCAKWLTPYLTFAREHGWRGTLQSGFRDPAFSERLCQRMCGAPTCPGRCAGRSSNHSGSVRPKGAIDVSDFERFGALMKKCPLSPRIFNDLPIDPVHYSATGH